MLLRLRKAGLRLKPQKCFFAMKEVKYLGYCVSEHGISADPAKVKAVNHFPRPKDLRHVRSFLGLASYYRRFIHQFSKVASPLYALTRKDTPFVWTEACEKSFSQLKSLLTKAPGVVWVVKHFRQCLYGHRCHAMPCSHGPQGVKITS